MTDLEEISRRFQEATGELKLQRETAIGKVREEVEKQKREVAKQRGDIEVQLQSVLGQLRTAERMEKRKRTLPLYKPQRLGTEARIEVVSAEAGKHNRELNALLDRVKHAEASELASIEQQVREKQADIEKWQADAKAEYRKWEKEQEEYKASLKEYEAEKKQPQAEQEEWEAKHIQLDNGEWVLKSEFDKLAPYMQGKLKEMGVKKFNKWNEEHPITVSVEGVVVAPPAITIETSGYVTKAGYIETPSEIYIQMPSVKEVPEVPEKPWYRKAWEFITPWQEAAGASLIGYLKETPERMFRPKVKTQAELKTQYEEYMAAPWWKRMLMTPVVKDKNTGQYHEVIAGYAPQIAPVPAGGIKTALKVAERTITRKQYETLAETLKNLPKPKREWLINPGKLLPSIRQIVTKITQPMVKQPVKLPRVQQVFHPSLPRTGFKYNSWTGMYEPIAPLQISKPDTLAKIGLKMVNGKLVKVTAADLSKAATTTITSTPLILPIPKLASVTTVGIIAYKIYTPELTQPIIVPTQYTEVQLTPELQNQIAQMQRTMTKSQVLAQLGVEEFTSTIQKTWLTPSQAIKQMQQSAIKTMTATKLIPATKAMPVTKVTPQISALQKQRLLQKQLQKLAKQKVAKPPKKLWRPPIRIPLPDGTSKLLTEKEAAGIIAWKQGFIYKLIYPPYGEKQIVNSRAPMAGVTYATGAGSAARSITARGGEVPKVVQRDMGIVDIWIETPRRDRKPRIKFKRDIKQRTRVTPRLSMVK